LRLAQLYDMQQVESITTPSPASLDTNCGDRNPQPSFSLLARQSLRSAAAPTLMISS
jgi:hypothetical protein